MVLRQATVFAASDGIATGNRFTTANGFATRNSFATGNGRQFAKRAFNCHESDEKNLEYQLQSKIARHKTDEVLQ